MQFDIALAARGGLGSPRGARLHPKMPGCTPGESGCTPGEPDSPAGGDDFWVSRDPYRGTGEELSADDAHKPRDESNGRELSADFRSQRVNNADECERCLGSANVSSFAVFGWSRGVLPRTTR